MNSDIKKIFNLSDICAYQNNSIVSQTIINKESGTVTIFSFDKNQGLSEHTAPFDALVVILDGEAHVTIDKDLFVLKKGEMIIMPENIPHALHAEKRFKMMLTLIGK